ncbi:hypothetical protein LZ24_02706 [Desulfobotulus alkaliphilus]|uniref:Uncharacterized protein n=1 Tax=Desulfobotulus alkaliphilus TaxID=622671 RepID=A0A562RFD2_9BACT|nr:hypothetical protein [Desulfobotulus alkaliphilus]TWI67777.1 hypothetical protein LZ24_02706 [Desulfobotulus alkaliphilus]
MSEYLNFVVGWFKNHGKAAKKEKEWEEIDIEGKKFYLADRVQEDIGTRAEGTVAYRIIYGYHIDSQKMACRMWYYSGSEANWRAFTGFRSRGAWAKGAEGFGDNKKKEHTKIGYVNECFVTSEMHTKLETFWEKNKCSRIVPHTFPWTGKPKAGSSDHAAYSYMVMEKNHFPELMKEYDTKRNFEPANFPANVEHCSIERSEKIGSVLVQEVYGKQPAKINLTKVKHGEVAGPISKHGQIFKHDTNLNAWIVGCLSYFQREEKKYHPVLKMDYRIRSYLMKGNAGPKSSSDLIVEIASTLNPREHMYMDYSGTVKKLNTPVCWVRDVYYVSAGMTSFGTRKDIPVNLSFLVQKPCDYPGQVSDDYNQMTGVETDSVNRDLGGGKYVILSLLNEATSPLIKTYKDQMGYPRFREKYHKAKSPINQAAMKLPAPGEMDYPDYLKILIFQGIREYMAIQMKEVKSYSDSGSHGSSGIKRARALSVCVEQASSEVEINQIMYRCFKENKVGDFSGGWFSGINTHPTSLFTCVCRSLLANAESPVGSVIKEMKWSEKSAEKCINRMIQFIYARGPASDKVSKSLHITNESESLLKALKGEKISA